MPENRVKPFPPNTPLTQRKSAIVVGASSGIGAALARKLSREGYRLALLSRRTELLDALCEEINEESGEICAHAYEHDVCDVDSVPELLQSILADLGTLDLFIYNAGVSRMVGLKKFDFEKDRQTLEINLVGALAWLNPIAAMFQELGAGQIVGISSVAGERGRVGNPSYNASKAALSSYLESMRNRLSRHGVNVLTVKPGFVDTDLLAGSKKTFWVITADQAANDICKAIQKRKQDIYTPARWRLVMMIVRNIPSFIFRRMVF
ncbi:SDR family NAD(P)-dependent oxidoreductase [Chloroflexota bacterium]